MKDNIVLIVDDDPNIIELVSRQVEDLGYEHESASDGRQGLEMGLANTYALIVLDLGLPKMGGVEVCRQLRKANETVPILILTGDSSELNAVLTLELGADEFIAKPLRPMEFRARLGALLRRASVGKQVPDKVESYEFKDLKIDIDSRRVSCGETKIELSSTEFDLFVFFLQSKNRVVSRDQITEHLWGPNTYTYEQNVRTTVSRLRARLDDVGTAGPYIVTRRGFGYQLATD